VDALIVDAEGLDADLVEAFFKLEGFRPTLVIFEHKHIPRPRLAKVTKRLRELGYVHLFDGPQLIAVLEA